MDETAGRWLGRAYKWLMPIALVAAISVAAVTVISAASDRNGQSDAQRWSEGTEEDNEDSGGECGHGGKRLGRWSGIAELVGTDNEGLKTALSEGKTLADIATENDIEVQSVIDRVGRRCQRAH